MDDVQPTGCCPKLDPSKWDQKTFEWDNKKFVKAKVFTLFYMPVNFGSVISKLMKSVEAEGTATPDSLCLSDHTSLFNMDIYLEVEKEVPGVENVTLSGKYLSKVYEGDFKDTGVWCKDFDEYVKSQGSTLEKMYMWYTTCPKCAKVYGKNYTVILGKVS